MEEGVKIDAHVRRDRRRARLLVEVSGDWTPADAGDGWRADRDHAEVRIVDANGELMRELVLDPTRDYQRQSA